MMRQDDSDMKTNPIAPGTGTGTPYRSRRQSDIGASQRGFAAVQRVPTYLQPSIPFHERLHHFTFAWYAVT